MNDSDLPDLNDDFDDGEGSEHDEEISVEDVSGGSGPLDDDPLPEGMTQEQLDRLESGVVNNAGHPDLKRIDDEKAVPMEPLTEGSKVPPGVKVPGEPAQKLEGPMASNIDVGPIAQALAGLGTQVRIKVTRFSPPGFPVEESGQSDWIPIPGSDPTTEDIERAVRERWGGGRYEVLISSTDPMRIDDSEKAVIELGGDPTPFTMIGRLHFKKIYGYAPTPSIAASEGGGPNTGGMGDMGGGVAVAELVMGMVERREQRERERELSKDRGETTLAVAAVEALSSGRSSGGGTIEIIAALAPLGVQLMQMQAEERRANREAAEQRHMQMLQMMKESSSPQQPQEIVQAMQSVIGIVQARAESEMKMTAENQQTLFKHMLKQMNDNGQEENATFLGTMLEVLREKGGDILSGVGPVIQQMMSGGQNAQQAAAVVAPNYIDPRSVAAQGGYAPQQALTPQVQVHQPVVAQPPTPQQAPPLIPQQPVEAPVQVPDGQPIEGPESAPGQPRQAPPPEQFAANMALDAMKQFVYYTSVFLTSKPEPDAAWGANMGGNNLEVLFGLSPKVFRDRVIVSFSTAASWVEGSDDTEIHQYAQSIDTLVSTDSEAKEWLNDFLHIGPWHDEDEED